MDEEHAAVEHLMPTADGYRDLGNMPGEHPPSESEQTCGKIAIWQHFPRWAVLGSNQ
jgi:hypothetical protein